MSTNVTINEETTKVVQITTPGPPGPPLAGVSITNSNITFDRTLKVTSLDSPTGTIAFTGDNFASFGNIATTVTKTGSFGHVATNKNILLPNTGKIEFNNSSGISTRALELNSLNVLNIGMSSLVSTTLFGTNIVLDSSNDTSIIAGSKITTFTSTGVSGSAAVSASFGHFKGDSAEFTTASFGNISINKPEGGRIIEFDSNGDGIGDNGTLAFYENDDTDKLTIKLASTDQSGKFELFNSNNDIPRIRLDAFSRNFVNSAGSFNIGTSAEGQRMGSYDLDSSTHIDSSDGEHLHVNVFGGIMITGSDSGRIQMHNGNITASNDIRANRLNISLSSDDGLNNSIFFGTYLNAGKIFDDDAHLILNYADQDIIKINDITTAIETNLTASGNILVQGTYDGHITASGNISSSISSTVQSGTGSFNTYQQFPWIKVSNCSLLQTSFKLIPMAGTTEVSSGDSAADAAVAIAPYDGYVEKVLLDFQSSPSSVEFAFFVTGSDQAINAVASGTEFEYAKEKIDFTIDNSGPDINLNRVLQLNFSSSFKAGDRLAFGIKPNSSPADFNATIVFRLDTSKGYPTADSDSGAAILHVN